MKISNIFDLVKGSLYSVIYDSEQYNEFSKLFELWNDQEYLRSFFEKHQEDLNRDIWNGISIDDAIIKTRKEARILEKNLLQIAKTGQTERYENLSTLFKPLTKNFNEPDNYFREKAYGLKSPSWLRIYAIRLEPNLYVVSGGAIKLTKDMNEREHLLLELTKLELTRNYLMDEETDELENVTYY
jgi:hypothetical protein